MRNYRKCVKKGVQKQKNMGKKCAIRAPDIVSLFHSSMVHIDFFFRIQVPINTATLFLLPLLIWLKTEGRKAFSPYRRRARRSRFRNFASPESLSRDENLLSRRIIITMSAAHFLCSFSPFLRIPAPDINSVLLYARPRGRTDATRPSNYCKRGLHGDSIV